MSTYLIFSAFLYILSYTLYINLSHGLGHKAEYLQLRRFLPCAILAVLPLYLSNTSILSKQYLISIIVGSFWILTYPYLFYVTNKKISSDFGFHFDTVFGLYLTGWLISLKILVEYFGIIPKFFLGIISCIEFVLLSIPIFQILYYLLYKTCIDTSAVNMILETYASEVIEFLKSLPRIVCIAIPLANIAILTFIINYNFENEHFNVIPTSNLYILIAITIFLTSYLWNTHKGVFIRTGFIELVLDVKDFIKKTKTYKTNMAQRIVDLKVERNNTSDSAETYILVIGESASRDYMKCFCNYEYNTTPWLESIKKEQNLILFPNAYACKDQTVPALENALTEANQYNDKKFYLSCSIVDIARKAGFKISWFSNQSHIGCADTPVTLVANTADVSEWTKLHLNQIQYDESLLQYLDTVNPQEKNFVVIHLKGSHFNFINRYPQSFAKFSKPNKYDLIPNYLDSIAYTDHILESIKEYADKHFNLQALVYFSDHATIPDKRRSPAFGGFATVRIPLFTYLTDEYIAKHPKVFQALQENKNKYWTNDLAYELICGIFDIKSNHYDERNSLASKTYKYSRDDLKTNLGELNIKDDL